MRYRIVALPLLLLLMTIISGCIAGRKVQKKIDVEQRRLSLNRERGADMCVPYELAQAQSHMLFAEKELALGNIVDAEDHIAEEKEYVLHVSKNADACIPRDKDEDGVVDKKDACPLAAGPEKYNGCPDTDGDGVIDKDDACPRVSGVTELKGCPPAKDTDKDGIPDKKDRCPFDAEDEDGHKDKDGCPDLDNDGDGVVDTKDKCPDTPGTPTNEGCPVKDRDGDGVPDEMDKCPDKPEDKDTFEDQDGCPDLDNDKDGIPDKTDKCPDDKGPKTNNGCPVNDRDGDGVPDITDKCPDKKEDIDSFEDADGCPDPDNDKDAIPDKTDKCPDTPGVKEKQGCPVTDKDGDGVPDEVDACPETPGKKELNGCPDRDGDGIADGSDKCPDKPGVKKNNGCPEKKYKLIVVTKKKIELKQKVFFATGKAIIRPGSFDMLREVADAVKNTPSIRKVVVEGHTDSRGSARLNRRLSKKRARAVVEFLEDEGVPSSKLESKGFGESSPIASNRTRRGRAKNRRVEFNIVR